MNVAPLRILYVEDNDALRETMALLLEDEGRAIALAADAEQAEQLCATGSFDLVLTDISLPGRSGTDLARRLLAVDPEQWIVLCSGRELDFGVHELGPNVRTLAKPFDFEALDRLILAAALAARAKSRS